MPYHDFLKEKLLDSLKLSVKKKKSKETFNKSQFNLLRIVDNELYPANFKYKNKTYLVKIYKYKN